MAEANPSALETRLRADVQNAQRQRDQVLLDTLRLALNAFHLEEVARTDRDNANYGKTLTEQDRLNILDKQVKQRNDSAAEFEKGGRPELAEKEKRERDILMAYLPAQKSPDEVRAMVKAIVTELPGETRNQGAVMKLAMAQLKGLADGNLVRQIVTEELGT